MLRALAALAVLLSLLLFAYGRMTAPDDVREAVPDLYGEWVAGEGMYEGDRIRLTRERVELVSGESVLDSGPLTGIYSVESDDGYDQFRVEYGLATEPGAITVMLDERGNLRLANRPATAWQRSGSSTP